MKIRSLCVALVLALSACAPTQTSHLPVIMTDKWDNVSDRLDTGIITPFDTMADVHAYVNKVPYMSDLKNYGHAAYWAPPKEFFRRGRGDCEDYVIAKYALGLENKLFKPNEAKLVKALDLEKGLQPHMLLVVGDEVYDNQIPQPFKLSSQEAGRYLMLASVNKTHG